MKSAEIREQFLTYYEGKGHQRVPSASLIPSSYDPSVLLTIAGMQPFKPYFLGQEEPPAQRLVDSQKCFRTPDIDQVGLTARHLTFFEMLGNFSFGDYFKQGAIEMAWDLVVNVYGIDADLLWATVHAGDEALGLGVDEEAVELWVQQGLPRERIVALGEDNFWKAGATGPCGPCSEIYYDRGPDFQNGCPDPSNCKPGCDCDRYLEFYNLVFMQYERDEAGKLNPLAKQNIDTGMGLERLSSIIQNVPSVFDIDSYQTIIKWAEQRSGRTYGDDPVATKAFRVLADHGRGMTFLASDGVMPNNEGRGYVLRRVIRRAIQHADRIGMYKNGKTGVLAELSQRVVDEFGGYFPELVSQRSIVVDILNAEEERFLATLAKGTTRLAEHTASGAKGSVFPGDLAFQLYDTYGFPIELTEELVAESGMSVDRVTFDRLMTEQRERARAAAGGGSLPVEAAAAFVRSAPTTEFVGYDTTATDTKVTAMELLANDGDAGDGQRVLIKLERSPFYAEGGGQVGDTGVVVGPRGRAHVAQVMRYDGDQVLVATVDGELAAGEQVGAEVDSQHRAPTESNHTATHLLHKALREQLGEHVRQAGSLVAPDRLRFDFTHTSSIPAADLAAIEALVNEHVAASEPVTSTEMAIDEAREKGAMMLFGEKYGDRVRLVEVGEGWSRELCGGTHVSNTSEIRLFLITSEASVGANTRRIEALTGDGAVAYLRVRADVADRAAGAANVDVDRLVERVEELTRSNRQLEKELSSLRSGADMDEALGARESLGELSLVVYRSDALSADELLELSDRLKQKLAPALVLVGGAQGDKVSLIASVSDDATRFGLDASALIKEISGIVGGGGGGRPTMARAGGKDASRLDEALQAGRAAVHRIVAAGNGGGQS